MQPASTLYFAIFHSLSVEIISKIPKQDASDIHIPNASCLYTDYSAEYTFTPLTGANHMVNFRVQGAIRSYAFGLLPDGKAAILKNDNGYSVLTETAFDWKLGEEYMVKVTAKGNCLKAEINGCVLEVCDHGRPYLTGSVGVSMRSGSHDKYRKIKVGGV